MRNIYLVLILGLVMSCGGGSDDSIEPEPEKENEAPSMPVGVYPLNNTLCIDNNVVFEWEAATDPENNSLRYKIEVAENNSFSPLTFSETLNSTTKTIVLEKGKTLYWRVKAIDNKAAESAYSSAAQFVVEGEAVSNHAPFAPALVAPEMNSEIDGLTCTLSWTSSDPDEGDSLNYDVYFDTVNPPVSKVSENQSSTTFDIGSLLAATTYYFRVNVKDDNGGTTIGQVWSFNTK
ncbi:fibronectin type III domain-containing protein [Algibacter pacificus]|uniref:fibronectin type III domain-containing protein n=1 Tax=Algibacter pacificus TaxID=2599389 RepID=UPI0011C9D8A9|nr:fibronectin type III domain-containing protein [Algibacter pacificus]